MRPIRPISVLVLFAIVLVLGATPVAADAVYHTDSLPCSQSATPRVRASW